MNYIEKKVKKNDIDNIINELIYLLDRINSIIKWIDKSRRDIYHCIENNMPNNKELTTDMIIDLIDTKKILKASNEIGEIAYSMEKILEEIS
ncbi:hypothetical protein PV797_16300 [Clostridiaceae bacterium M8S5]|nr:hypothetical protein PV797_16300 [Clostridiaceae bacterium M8S5]